MTEEQKHPSWWRSIPGAITAVAGVITAVTGLILALHQIGVFDDDESPASKTSSISQEARERPNETATTPQTHCKQPTTTVLKSPGANQVQPNHFYGKGKPLKFSWLKSSCDGGSIKGYRIFVKSAGATVPAIDTIVTQPEYTGGTGGTIAAHKWTWKVQAIDDRNQVSEWSEERPFFVGEWKE
ncbi:MAG: hypothetical protein GY731_17730 [Gammaproteobacteria bacterium]|nr:hypothetical protein [Gammaproteobacteria bacterium]